MWSVNNLVILTVVISRHKSTELNEFKVNRNEQ